MSQANLVAETETAIQNKIRELFSDGALADKARLARELCQMSGLDLFMTALPWKIDLGQNRSIDGHSENLRSAANDIYSQLVTLGRTLSPEAVITIEIDGARLPPLQKQAQPLRTIEGG